MENHIKDFLFHCKFEKNLSTKTLAAYEIDLRQFNSFFAKGKRDPLVRDVDKYVLKQYLETISPKFKPKTLKRKLASLKAFFNYMQFEDEIDINPFNKVKIKIKEGKRVPRTIDPRIIKRLYRYLYDKKECLEPESYAYQIIVRDIAVLELLFSTGLRVSELSHLKTSSLSLTKSTIRITGKGNKERLIPICSADTREALNSYFKLYRKRIENAEFFFLNRFDRRLSEQSIRFMIKKYMNNLNVSDELTPSTAESSHGIVCSPKRRQYYDQILERKKSSAG